MPDQRTWKSNTLRDSYLVQRLRKPVGTDNPFAFGGGGYKNGGLSDDAMALTRSIWSYDYMGSAEFEWGAVPDALNHIANHRQDYVARTTAVPLSEVPPSWQDKRPAPRGEGTVYLIAPAAWTDVVIARIQLWATRLPHQLPRPGLKEATNLPGALRPYHEWDKEYCGWLELDNGFFFFTDRTMWERTCALFEVKVP